MFFPFAELFQIKRSGNPIRLDLRKEAVPRRFGAANVPNQLKRMTKNGHFSHFTHSKFPRNETHSRPPKSEIDRLTAKKYALMDSLCLAFNQPGISDLYHIMFPVQVENALMLQSITCQDERGQTLSRGMKMVRGGMQDNGPITTLSGDGKDLSLTYQGYAALDNVAFVNGNQLGRRCILQVGGHLNTARV